MPQNLQAIQYLRGIAALLVVYFHTKVYLADFSFGLPRQFGYFGVDIFFCVSGFIMMFITSVKDERPIAFLMKRVGRIYPMYWLATLASLSIFALMPSAFLSEVVTFRHVVLSLLLFPHEDPSGEGAAPLLRIGWTLIFEVYFYLVFAAALFFRTPRTRLLVLAGYMVAVVAYGLLAAPQYAPLRYATNGFVLEFLFGAAIGYWALGNGPAALPGKAVIALLAIAAVTVAFGAGRGDGLSRVVWFGLPAACLVIAFVAIERKGRLVGSRLLEAIGDASYSLYLFHPFVLTATRVVAKTLQIPQDSAWIGAGVVFGATLGSAVVGLIVYRLVEKPLQTYVRRWIARGQTRRPEPILAPIPRRRS